MTNRRTDQLAILILVLVNVVWGGSLPATKLGLTDFTPWVLSWLRLSLSAVLFLILLTATRELGGLKPRDWLTLASLGVVGYSGTIGLQTLGASGTTGSSAAVLGSTGPIFILLFGLLLLRERPRPIAIGGLIVALGGVAALMGLSVGDPTLGHGAGAVGSLMVLGSSACFGAFTILGKRSLERFSPVVVSGITCLGGAIGLTVPALLELAGGFPKPSLLGLGTVLYLGGAVTFAGMIAWFWALRGVQASRGGAFLFLQPVSGIALAALLLGDRLSPTFVVGTGLVLVGLVLVARA